MKIFIKEKYKRPLLALTVSLSISFAIFSNTISGDFVMDDHLVLVGNPLIDRNVPDFVGIFTHPYNFFTEETGLYRPISMLSFGINFFLFGKSPISFHVVNIILHAIAGWLIFMISKRFVSWHSSLIGMALFLALPIHVEAVASIANRTETISLIFSLLVLYYALKDKFNLSSILLFLGLLSKETSVSILPVIFIFLFLQGKTMIQITRSMFWYIPSFLLYAILRINVLGSRFISPSDNFIVNQLIDAPIINSLLASFKILFLYIVKTLIPTNLSPDYSYNQISTSIDSTLILQSIVGLSVIVAITFIIFKSKNRLIILGGLIFLGSYAIISNILVKIPTIMADRLFYAPSAGLILMFTSCIDTALNNTTKKMLIYKILSVIFIIYAGTSFFYNQYWLSQASIIRHGYQSSPKSVVMQTAYANEIFKNGEKERAIRLIEEVLSQTPQFPMALITAGEMYAFSGNTKKGESLWLESIKLKNNAFNAYINLGTLYYQQKKYKKAEEILERSVSIYPLWEHVAYLGLVKIRLNKPQEAIDLIDKYSDKYLNDQSFALVLGLAHRSLGNIVEANLHLRSITDPRVLSLYWE